ncbi:MAG: hypothetical protein CBD97_01015 [Pelagibacteraceae bacterium TMED237]|nr:glutamyl-tRNA amidotransferase [Candidatus Neomarinimicrobiota bacterium]OUW96646.1 MAG: hypothetical protein CBD97_01015 [Pelagibacteraceae bacterium TMED237]|tara:strand:- start:9800 stop:10240 length:441 start_codon:yes stop_codon:yes gene_type:complete
MIAIIRNDLNKAIKAGNKNEINALRNLLSRFKSKEIDKGEKLNDAESIKICFSAAKQIKESITQFEKAGRKDLIDKEHEELNIIKNYLPNELSKEKITLIIQDVIKSTGADSPSDMGKVMGPIMKEIAGRADGKIVQSLVIRELNS